MKTKGRQLYIVLPGIIGCLLPICIAKGGTFLSRPLLMSQLSIFVCGLIVLFLCWEKPKKFCFSRNDIVLAVYLCWGLINWLIYRDQIPVEIIYKWISLASLYLLCRSINMRLLPLFLFIAALLQVGIGVLQYVGYIKSYHHFFRITGSFGNPSQLGGYLAVILTVVLGWGYQVLRPKCKKMFVILLFVVPWIFWLLVLTDSRAAWIAVGGGLFYVFYLEIKQRTRLCKGVLVFLIVCTAGLYFYKPLSASSRLYIWQISMHMVKDKPIAGHGLHSFPKTYMLYQADYFNRQPASEYASLADHVTSPYNELIHVMTEQGIAGGAALVLLFGCFLYPVSGEQRIYRGGILAFLIFSCFSYPGENYSLLYLLAMLMGGVGSKESACFTCSHLRIFVVATLFLWIGYTACKTYLLYKQWDREIRSSEGRRHFADYWECFRLNPELLQHILRMNDSLQPELALRIQEQIARQLPAPATYCDLGDRYCRMGQYLCAEYYYEIASHMVPAQLRANYSLFKLYEVIHCDEKAVRMAEKIMQQKIKVENTFTLEVKGEISRFLLNKAKE